jgi:hypothetical protein
MFFEAVTRLLVRFGGANIGRAGDAVKQKSFSTSQNVCRQLLGMFVHSGRPQVENSGDKFACK